MDLFVDPAPRTGKSDALYAQLRDAIVGGRLREGDRLPTSRALADELGISRNTVTAVYGRLVAEGFVSGRGSAGSFVSFADSSTSRVRRPSALSSTSDALVDATDWSLGEFALSEPTIDLRTGRPDPTLFPLRVWRRCVTDGYHAPPPAYGDPAGVPTLRRAIAHWVGRSRGVEADAGQVIVSAGAQQAVDLVARLLVRPGDVVAVEDPGYPPVANLFASHRAVIAPVRVDADGIVVDEIPVEARLVYVTPSHQSPTGVVMSMTRRRALLDLAAERRVAIVEDDYDTEYRHGDRPLEPIYRLDVSGRAIYIGTFSKTLSPSLRLGFVVLPPSLMTDAVALRSVMDWQPPAAAQHALYTFIVDGHLDRHLRRTRPLYTERQRIVTEWLTEQHRAGYVDDVFRSEAGLHIAARLAVGLTEPDVRQVAAEGGVALSDYRSCWRRSADGEAIIVGFGAAGGAKLDEGLGVLADAFSRIV